MNIQIFIVENTMIKSLKIVDSDVIPRLGEWLTIDDSDNYIGGRTFRVKALIYAIEDEFNSVDMYVENIGSIEFAIDSLYGSGG